MFKFFVKSLRAVPHEGQSDTNDDDDDDGSEVGNGLLSLPVRQFLFKLGLWRTHSQFKNSNLDCTLFFTFIFRACLLWNLWRRVHMNASMDDGVGRLVETV